MLCCVSAGAEAQVEEPAGVDAVPAADAAPPADGAAEQSPGSVTPLLFGGLIALWIYMLFIRPANRARAREEAMRENLRVNAEVITTGGIHGTVAKAPEGADTVTIKVDQNTRLTVSRDSIRTVVDRTAETSDETKKP